jgi:hypothetical protein
VADQDAQLLQGIQRGAGPIDQGLQYLRGDANRAEIGSSC